jgi:hypothetical protein
VRGIGAIELLPQIDSKKWENSGPGSRNYIIKSIANTPVTKRPKYDNKIVTKVSRTLVARPTANVTGTLAAVALLGKKPRN